MRLDKFLAQSAVGKRKVVRAYIKEGLVKVNGEFVIEPAIEINEKTDVIEYLGEVVEYADKVYYVFNKPAGYVTAKADNTNKTIFDFFKDEDSNGMFHVGRLDKDTEGLLLLTNDGEFEHKIMHPKKHIDKTYYFAALGSLDEEHKKLLEQGVYLGKDEDITKPAKIKVEKFGVYEDFRHEISVKRLNDINSSNYRQPVVFGYLTISEGRNHQVKRMLKTVGCKVVYLKRVAIGGLQLENSLEKGQYRKLAEEDIEKIFNGEFGDC